MRCRIHILVSAVLNHTDSQRVHIPGHKRGATVGYEELRSNVRPVAKFFLEAFPKSGNVYDSLAEAYLANGDRDLSIANYKHSLELNAANHNAEGQLKKNQAKWNFVIRTLGRRDQNDG